MLELQNILFKSMLEACQLHSWHIPLNPPISSPPTIVIMVYPSQKIPTSANFRQVFGILR